ncbi:site-specific integrase [Chryseobacterium sp. SIMBA_038]|uniref:site-specific integrase n=1 Tax=Chryseobacterium sp. SIMBA_038 TaxID=3085780 RepID=UPI00397DE160
MKNSPNEYFRYINNNELATIFETMTDFKYLEKYFHKYLIGEYGASKHTIRAYRDSFALLLSFMYKVKFIDADKIELKNISKDVILDFLSWLEYEHNNNVATRNQRCAAIRSFF